MTGLGSESYRNSVSAAADAIRNTCFPKRLDGKEINGEALKEALSHWIEVRRGQAEKSETSGVKQKLDFFTPLSRELCIMSFFLGRGGGGAG